jgi:AhpD family alkylhydroperoxidase
MSRPDAPIELQKQLPDVVQALLAVYAPITAAAALEPALQHLVVLRASQINQCGYCVKMHTREARAAGETSERLDRLVVWRHVGDFSARESAALAWTEAVTQLDPHSDYGPLRAELRAHFSDVEIAALTATIAMINVWNRIQVSDH